MGSASAGKEHESRILSTEELVDETIADSFPASDPPFWTLGGEVRGTNVEAYSAVTASEARMASAGEAIDAKAEGVRVAASSTVAMNGVDGETLEVTEFEEVTDLGPDGVRVTRASSVTMMASTEGEGHGKWRLAEQDRHAHAPCGVGCSNPNASLWDCQEDVDIAYLGPCAGGRPCIDDVAGVYHSGASSTPSSAAPHSR